MPDLVINTGPVIALTAALGDLDLLSAVYEKILLPQEVYQELLAGGKDCPELSAVKSSSAIQVADEPVEIPAYLQAELDTGEASVVQTARTLNWPLVAIDEKAGRRIARLHGLNVTGSVGILIKGLRAGIIDDLPGCFDRMAEYGIWISTELRREALRMVES